MSAAEKARCSSLSSMSMICRRSSIVRRSSALFVPGSMCRGFGCNGERRKRGRRGRVRSSSRIAKLSRRVVNAEVTPRCCLFAVNFCGLEEKGKEGEGKEEGKRESRRILGSEATGDWRGDYCPLSTGVQCVVERKFYREGKSEQGRWGAPHHPLQ